VALLSVGGFGEPSSMHGHRQGLTVREAAAKPFTLGKHAPAVNEEADRPDPHKSGGSALPPTPMASTAIQPQARLSPVSLAVQIFAKRSGRAHPATGPPLA
jgi:hypothetical protein